MEKTVLLLSKKGSSEPTETVFITKWLNNNDIECVTRAGVKCTAIFNPFNGMVYADDVYGVIERGISYEKLLES